MSRGTASSLTTPFRGVDDARPIWLIRIATGMPSPTALRYHDARQSEAITFDGESYSARGVDIPDQRIQASTETGSIPLRVQDPDGVLAGYVLARHSFADQRVILRLTDRAVIDAGGTAAYRQDYLVEGVDLEEGAVVFTLRPQYGVFATDVPGGEMTRADFPGIPHGALI